MNIPSTCSILMHVIYQMDSVSKVMHCKAKHANNLKPEPTILDAWHVILLSNLPKTYWNILPTYLSIEQGSTSVLF